MCVFVLWNISCFSSAPDSNLCQKAKARVIYHVLCLSSITGAYATFFPRPHGRLWGSIMAAVADGADVAHEGPGSA